MGQKQSERQGRQATKRASPPPGYYSGRGCQCRKRSDAGARGAEPPAKKLIVSPFPPGRALCERGQGDGGEKAS